MAGDPSTFNPYAVGLTQSGASGGNTIFKSPFGLIPLPSNTAGFLAGNITNAVQAKMPSIVTGLSSKQGNPGGIGGFFASLTESLRQVASQAKNTSPNDVTGTATHGDIIGNGNPVTAPDLSTLVSGISNPGISGGQSMMAGSTVSAQFSRSGDGMEIT